MTPLRRLRAPGGLASALTLALAATAMAACSPPSQQDIETAQALTTLGESYNDLRLTQQELQDQVDSLKTLVAKQDSVIRTLANLAGVQLPR